MKREFVVGIIVLIFGVILAISFFSGNEESEVEDIQVPVVEATPELKPSPSVPETINFETYNQDYADDEGVKNQLNQILGSNGKTAFYLPAIGYVNVSRGTKYGVAFALHNSNPTGSGVNWDSYNDFRYDWTVDKSVIESCGADVKDAQAWIERGSYSWGKMAQGWIDHMTIYFSFPANIEPCTVKYNFEVTKDGAAYDSRVLEIKLI